jgi:twitching motility protein PilT
MTMRNLDPQSGASPCPYQMNELLELMVEQKASDLHINVGQTPALRIDGVMTPVEGPVLRPSDTDDLMRAITSEPNQGKLKTNGGADFGFTYKDNVRFRVNIFKSRGSTGMVLRIISSKMLTFAQIGLPDSIVELLTRPRGLILVTGPTGSGKSTTLASMVNWINENRDGHIITIEDPIEYFHPHKRCLVTQREVGTDVPTFADAIRGALRQDPNVILLGEMRDLETMEAAISAAETGHLVLATLHTTGAARTVDRIVDAFPAEAKDQIRTQLSSSILAVISQVLLPKVGGGRVGAFEIMVATTSIRALIRENKTFRIASDIQTGARFGMIALDAYLMSLVTRGIVTADDALEKSQSPDDFKNRLRENGITYKEY